MKNESIDSRREKALLADDFIRFCGLCGFDLSPWQIDCASKMLLHPIEPDAVFKGESNWRATSKGNVRAMLLLDEYGYRSYKEIE